MAQPHITWVSYHEPEILSRGYWDQGQLEDIFALGDYVHHTGFKWLEDYQPAEIGSIVVINGRTHYEIDDVIKLNNDLSLLKWVILIVTGDEESLFDQTLAKHPLMKIWVQLPRLHKHNDVFRMPNGYRPATRKILSELGHYRRKEDWCFVGQVTHKRRQECAEIARQLPNGILIETHSFGGLESIEPEGESYEDYLSDMKASKFALCPSGPASPDSFRVWEALEAGCIPIVDSHSTNNPTDGFWPYLLGDDLPFPVLREWSELPQLIETLKRDYPRNANRVFAWWQVYKRQMRKELESSVASWL